MSGPIKPQVYAVSVETSSDFLDDSCITFYQGLQNSYTDLVQQQLDHYMTDMWRDAVEPKAVPPKPTRRERFRYWLANRLLAVARKIHPDILEDYWL